MNLSELLHATNAYYCLECGVCTGSCPVSRLNPHFSPRLTVERALLMDNRGASDGDIWTCLTCGACSARCPAQVDYNEFSRLVRTEALLRGETGVMTHSGIMQAMSGIQLQADIEKNMERVTDALDVAAAGDYLYFVGCQPYFSIVFEVIGVDTLGIARASIRILNSMGITPVVSPQERCCGHDAYWTGDLETFKTLAGYNLRMIKSSGAKTVVFSCPEGYAMFKLVYPRFFGRPRFEVTHLLELVAARIGGDGFALKRFDGKVTYQDPCRLGRFLGIYEAPRTILRAMPGLELCELPASGPDAVCCGSSAWVNCSMTNKQIQLQKLQEARDTGADMLITACPKCQIHLKCTLSDADLRRSIAIEDIHILLANSLGG